MAYHAFIHLPIYSSIMRPPSHHIKHPQPPPKKHTPPPTQKQTQLLICQAPTYPHSPPKKNKKPKNTPQTTKNQLPPELRGPRALPHHLHRHALLLPAHARLRHVSASSVCACRVCGFVECVRIVRICACRVCRRHTVGDDLTPLALACPNQPAHHPLYSSSFPCVPCMRACNRTRLTANPHHPSLPMHAIKP